MNKEYRPVVFRNISIVQVTITLLTPLGRHNLISELIEKEYDNLYVMPKKNSKNDCIIYYTYEKTMTAGIDYEQSKILEDCIKVLENSKTKIHSGVINILYNENNSPCMCVEFLSSNVNLKEIL